MVRTMNGGEDIVVRGRRGADRAPMAVLSVVIVAAMTGMRLCRIHQATMPQGGWKPPIRNLHLSGEFIESNSAA